MNERMLTKLFLSVLTTSAAHALVGCGSGLTCGSEWSYEEEKVSVEDFDAAVVQADTTGGDACASFCDETSVGSDGQDISFSYCYSDYDASDSEAESVTVTCEYGYLCEGRRPEGLCSDGRKTHGPLLGRHLARAAHMEAASVSAFRHLARELAAHDAPPELVGRAKAAARDEVRHARAMTALAKQRGAVPEPARVGAMPLRSLEALALENAVEGCVGETFAALMAYRQAAHATDPEISSTMRTIAEDETRHAALAYAVSAWVSAKLPIEARLRVKAARQQAVSRLLAGCEASQYAEPVRTQLGLPLPTESVAMAKGLAAKLWS